MRLGVLYPWRRRLPTALDSCRHEWLRRSDWGCCIYRVHVFCTDFRRLVGLIMKTLFKTHFLCRICYYTNCRASKLSRRLGQSATIILKSKFYGHFQESPQSHLSRLMRLWHLSHSVNSIFKHACVAIHWGYTSDIWSDPSSTSILSLRCSPMR